MSRVYQTTLVLLLLTDLFLPLYLRSSYQQLQPCESLDCLRAQHQKILDQLNAPGPKGEVVNLDDPRVPALLKQGWQLAGEWAAAFFDAHSSPSKSELASIFAGFASPPNATKSEYGDFLEYHDYSFSGRATQIGPGVYVVDSSYLGIDFPTGNFTVVARGSDGKFHALWNMKDLAEQHYSSRDEIGRWFHLTRQAYHSGPLGVRSVVPLPKSAIGHPRFLVQALQGAHGGTQLGQISIWEWTGSEALPLLVERYYFAYQTGAFHFDGRTVRITTKEAELQTLPSCGGCDDPRGVWTIRITPTGVHNLGHRFVHPEYKWTDDLLSSIEEGRDASALASPKVVSLLRSNLSQLESAANSASNEKPAESEKPRFSLGMLGKLTVLQRNLRGGKFILACDEATLHFAYALRSGKPFFTSLTITTE